MRTMLVVVIAMLCSTASAKPLPCPKDLQTKLKDEYMEGDPPDPKSIKIAQCVWGNFAGPGWFVEHLVPWGKHSNAETAPFGGEAFIAKDGTVAASSYGGGSESISFRVVDLDGDGVDEIVATNHWSGNFESGEMLSVMRVVGRKIENVFSKNVSYDVMPTPGAITCKGTLVIQPAPGGGKQLVVTVKSKTAPDPDPDPYRGAQTSCLEAGKHIFRYTKADGVAEVTK